MTSVASARQRHETGDGARVDMSHPRRESLDSTLTGDIVEASSRRVKRGDRGRFTSGSLEETGFRESISVWGVRAVSVPAGTSLA